MLNEYLFTNIEEEDIGNIWLLHSMFYALFLKIALSAPELMSISYLGAEIWLRWTIIYAVPIKDKCYADKPETIDAFKKYSCSHWWNTAAHNR